jgi:hypothetical protein
MRGREFGRRSSASARTRSHARRAARERPSLVRVGGFLEGARRVAASRKVSRGSRRIRCVACGRLLSRSLATTPTHPNTRLADHALHHPGGTRCSSFAPHRARCLMPVAQRFRTRRGTHRRRGKFRCPLSISGKTCIFDSTTTATHSMVHRSAHIWRTLGAASADPGEEVTDAIFSDYGGRYLLQRCPLV